VRHLPEVLARGLSLTAYAVGGGLSARDRKRKGLEMEIKGCVQCGDTSDLLAMFTRSGVCGKCARKNHREALGIKGGKK